MQKEFLNVVREETRNHKNVREFVQTKIFDCSVVEEHHFYSKEFPSKEIARYTIDGKKEQILYINEDCIYTSSQQKFVAECRKLCYIKKEATFKPESACAN